MTAHVLFVCLGNICRSPLAEAAFRKVSIEAGVAAEAADPWYSGEVNFHGTWVYVTVGAGALASLVR